MPGAEATWLLTGGPVGRGGKQSVGVSGTRSSTGQCLKGNASWAAAPRIAELCWSMAEKKILRIRKIQATFLEVLQMVLLREPGNL